MGKNPIGENTGSRKTEMEGRDDQIGYMHEILKSNEKYPFKEDTHDATGFWLAWELGLQDEWVLQRQLDLQTQLSIGQK